MPLLISFKDAVNANGLDQNATDAVYYCDGLYANEAAVRARCPRARLHAITVRGATGKGIFALDSENGDIDTGAKVDFPETETWVSEQIKLGVEPIVVYANQDRWLNLGLLAALGKLLQRLGQPQDRIERWDADYDGVATVPPWASAKQYMDGNVDLNVALAGFFDGPPKPAPDPKFASFKQAFNGGFTRGFNVGYSRRHNRPLPAYVRPSGQAVAYSLGFQAGFVKGWVAC